MSTEPSPTDRELEILKVLWEIGEASVRDVHQRLVDDSGLHFNTIQTQLRIMADKGLVTHRLEGRALFYSPVCTREQVSSRFLHKVFNGALDQLVLSMLNAEKVNDSELKEIAKLVADARKEAKPRNNTSRK